VLLIGVLVMQCMAVVFSLQECGNYLNIAIHRGCHDGTSSKKVMLVSHMLVSAVGGSMCGVRKAALPTG
jgi:hypothetical protein